MLALVLARYIDMSALICVILQKITTDRLPGQADVRFAHVFFHCILL